MIYGLRLLTAGFGMYCLKKCKYYLEYLFYAWMTLLTFKHLLLFQLGSPSFGFTLPFVVVGSFHFVSASMVNCVAFSKKHEGKNELKTSNSSSPSPLGFFRLLKVPTVFIFVYAMFMSGLSYGVVLGKSIYDRIGSINQKSAVLLCMGITCK